MNISLLSGRRRLFLLAALCILSSIVAVGVYSRARQTPKKKDPNRTSYYAEEVTTPPEVKSKVEGLEIAGVSIVDQGTAWAKIKIDIINHRDAGLMAMDFVVYKSPGNSGGVGMAGSQLEPPLPLIPPHSLESFEFFLSSFMEGPPIFLASAIFSDGKEEGDQNSVQGLKHTRQDLQKRRDAEKARNGGPQ